MQQPRIRVDFNEMVEPDLVLLSTEDQRQDSSGALVFLSEGLEVHIYEKDFDMSGREDNLIADGLVESFKHNVSWGGHAKWCCRIDQYGVRHESKVK